MSPILAAMYPSTARAYHAVREHPDSTARDLAEHGVGAADLSRLTRVGLVVSTTQKPRRYRLAHQEAK